jgi:hypothetical protein
MNFSHGIKLRANSNIKNKTADSVLGYKNITLLFNLGQAEGGGNLILVQADGKLVTINSNDLINDLPVYKLVE